MAFLKIFTAVMAGLSVAQGMALRSKRQGLTWDYNNDKVYCVNLGGWFVLEPFITPSLFEQWADSQQVVDEYTLSQTLGPAETLNRLSAHWNTWITEADFQEIASIGLNHVRIPVGFWAVLALPGYPYVQGQLTVLDKAIVWARNAGLKVIIDLHGAPGSQNGYDNSGRRGAIGWQSDPNNVVQTLVAIKALTDRYAHDNDVVTVIEALNEPAGYDPAINMDAVKQFYWDAYGNVRTDNPTPALLIHDAFQDIDSFWNGFMNTDSGAYDVMLDTHIYQIFSDAQVAMSPSDHISAACANGAKVAGTDKWTIVGEWVGAQTDCARWLNGLGRGARYDGTYESSTKYGDCQAKFQGTVDTMLQVDKTNMRMYIEAQLDAYDKHTGWCYWTWRTETAPEWHMQNQTKAALFPVPPTDRKYPGQCGF